MTTKREYDTIVVGLGGLGSAAAYWLARRTGGNVLGLEQFHLGHDRGASEDHSRIIRLTYHTPTYVELAHHAYTAWRDLEEDAQTPLLVISGDIFMAPRDGPIDVEDFTSSLAVHNVPFERLDAAEIMHRWPQFHLSDDVHGVFQAQGGIAPAAKGNATHVRMARQYGATLLENTPVTAITPLADGVEVTTAETTYRGRHLVLTVDAWTNELLAHVGLHLPLTLLKEQVTYFASPYVDEFRPDRFPVWIWLNDPGFYGLPVYGEEQGVKAAQDMAGHEITLETRTFEPDEDNLARVTAFVKKTLPRAYGPPLYSKTCIYTLTPDRDFVIDHLPQYPQISIALGGGHAFKFAGVIGRILSDLSIDGTTSYNIAPFKIDRPVLTMPNPPRHFLLKRHTIQPS